MAAGRSSADAIAFEIEERRGRVYELRLEGKSYREIASELGISHQTAHSDAMAVMDRLKAETIETAERVREIELARLDKAQKAIWPDVKQGDQGAIDTFLKIQARRAKLMGLDAPEKHDVTTAVTSATPAEAARLVREAFREFKPSDLATVAESDAGDPSGTP
jgi:transposase